MKMALSTICAALLGLAIASPALADGTVKATLEAPVTGHPVLIAGSAVFHCEETTCFANTDSDNAGDVDACRDLARQVGPISSYQEFKPLDDKKLAKCNASAAHKPTGTASR